MGFNVLMTRGAEDDVFSLWSYLTDCRGMDDADYVVGELERVIFSLADAPMRGHIPPELGRLHVGGFLQVHFKPYRIIYQVTGKDVFVFCVLDGRRDVESVLRRRLLA